MLKFLLYAVLVFFIIQMVRTTMRIRSNVKQGRERGGDEEVQKPPVLNIPDIQDATFEDLPNEESTKKDQPDKSPNDTPPSH